MSNALTKPAFTNLALTTTHNNIERFANDRDVRDIYKEGIKHLVAERVHAAKTITAINLATEVHSHALTTADRFARDVYERLAADDRTPEGQAYTESVTQTLMGMYREHISGLVQVGVTNIAREAARDVLIHKEEKRGWFR